MTSNTESCAKDISQMSERLFITETHHRFNAFIDSLDEPTRHMIRKNAQLNALYDTVLDYVLDSAILLDKTSTHCK
jgi:uncharacterized protein (DUF1778 family)